MAYNIYTSIHAPLFRICNYLKQDSWHSAKWIIDWGIPFSFSSHSPSLWALLFILSICQRRMKKQLSHIQYQYSRNKRSFKFYFFLFSSFHAFLFPLSVFFFVAVWFQPIKCTFFNPLTSILSALHLNCSILVSQWQKFDAKHWILSIKVLLLLFFFSRLFNIYSSDSDSFSLLPDERIASDKQQQLSKCKKWNIEFSRFAMSNTLPKHKIDLINVQLKIHSHRANICNA